MGTLKALQALPRMTTALLVKNKSTRTEPAHCMILKPYLQLLRFLGIKVRMVWFLQSSTSIYSKT